MAVAGVKDGGAAGWKGGVPCAVKGGGDVAEKEGRGGGKGLFELQLWELGPERRPRGCAVVTVTAPEAISTPDVQGRPHIRGGCRSSVRIRRTACVLSQRRDTASRHEFGGTVWRKMSRRADWILVCTPTHTASFIYFQSKWPS
jgi:hypothetical protein